jgi:hypothetical protein
MMDIFKTILEKIENKTVTAEDFNALIAESTPSSVQERIRRRVQKNATKSHIDREGHQPLSAPNMAGRVKPKRKPANKDSHGRGKIGRKHSSATIKAMHEGKDPEETAKTDDKYFDKAKEISKLIKDEKIIKYLIDNKLIDSNFAHAILKGLENE